MHHVAIMRKSWKLTEKILSGGKRVESRWYLHRRAPWDRIREGDVVFFKEGKYVSARAEVEKVLQFSDLTEQKVKELLDEYATADGISDRKEFFYQLFKRRKYCILVFLKNPCGIEPFAINKKGFGSMASWICVDDINSIRT